MQGVDGIEAVVVVGQRGFFPGMFIACVDELYAVEGEEVSVEESVGGLDADEVGGGPVACDLEAVGVKLQELMEGSGIGDGQVVKSGASCGGSGGGP